MGLTPRCRRWRPCCSRDGSGHRRSLAPSIEEDSSGGRAAGRGIPRSSSVVPQAVRDPRGICIRRSQEVWRRVSRKRGCPEACRGRVARPFPVTGRIAQPGSHRVQGDVAGELQEVVVVGDESGTEAPLIEVPGPVVTLVECLRGTRPQPVHGRRQVPELRGHQQMSVVWEEAPGMALELESRLRLEPVGPRCVRSRQSRPQRASAPRHD